MSFPRLPTLFTTPSSLRLALASSIPILAYLLRLIYLDFRAWHSLGAGGVPHNLLGYLAQSCARLALAQPDTRSPQPYMSVALVSVYQRAHNASYLDAANPLPLRAGPRPAVPSYVAPQRQITQPAPAAVRQAALAAFRDLAGRNTDLVRLGASNLEGGRGPAYFLPAAALQPPFTARTKGEIAHIHSEAEGSAHVLLTPRDAKQVVERGWGERHLLSGVVAPVGYTLLYAPRDQGELDVFVAVLRAAVRAATGGAALK